MAGIVNKEREEEKNNEGAEELTAGLEVHQQLDTSKLFCSCPSRLRDDPPDFTVQRALRASAGESGETDQAALHESHKDKKFYYQGYSDTTCLIELDEEPVSKMNSDAVAVALQVAAMLKMKVVDEIHVMRKTVVDGSNTSGFQRTALIALDGEVEVDEEKISIEQLCLEEDACKLVSRETQTDTYNLSRLGIPLLEITTGPDLHSSEQVKKVAAHIGMLLRSTERVKRGLGTIRQDVNVSVPGGARVEIKGAQDLDSLSLLVENEAKRQRALINLTQAIPTQEYNLLDITDCFRNTKAKFIQKAVSGGGAVLGVKLSQWGDALEAELAPGLRLGRELASYAKASGLGGLVHSSEDLSKYNFTEETELLRRVLGCGQRDAWLFIVGEKNRVRSFFDQVLSPRMTQLSTSVPKEVRRAEQDATTSFLRPMPGAARMYPETDVHPLTPPVGAVSVPELLTHKAARISKQYGVHPDLAEQVCKEGLGGLLEKWIALYPRVNPGALASLLSSKEREFRTRYGVEADIASLAPTALEWLNEEKISLNALDEVLLALAKGEAVELSRYSAVSEEELEMVVKQVLKENPEASFGALMGKVMRHFDNRADGKLVNELLRKAGVGR